MAAKTDWSAWAEEVMAECLKHKYSGVGERSYLLDCKAAFDLGWSPTEAAEAVLRVNRKKYAALCDYLSKNRGRYG